MPFLPPNTLRISTILELLNLLRPNVESVSRISIWFTQVPQDNSVSIRLVDAYGSLVTDVNFETDQTSATLFTAVLERALASGRYKVAWRGIGQDGHPVIGDYIFTVSESSF